MSERAASDRGAVVPPPAPRLTLSELARLQLQALSRSGGEHSTVELSRNAKGDTQISVKVRTGDPGVETAEQAFDKARELYDRARELYPPAAPNG